MSDEQIFSEKVEMIEKQIVFDENPRKLPDKEKLELAENNTLTSITFIKNFTIEAIIILILFSVLLIGMIFIRLWEKLPKYHELADINYNKNDIDMGMNIAISTKVLMELRRKEGENEFSLSKIRLMFPIKELKDNVRLLLKVKFKDNQGEPKTIVYEKHYPIENKFTLTKIGVNPIKQNQISYYEDILDNKIHGIPISNLITIDVNVTYYLRKKEMRDIHAIYHHSIENMDKFPTTIYPLTILPQYCGDRDDFMKEGFALMADNELKYLSNESN